MKKTKKSIAICFTFGLLMSAGTNVYASSQSVDLTSNVTSKSSSNLDATSVRMSAENSSGSAGRLSARVQYRTGSIFTKWHNDVSRTVAIGNSISNINSYRFQNSHPWRLQLARANDNLRVTASGRIHAR